MLVKRTIAELLGTFVLVFGGVGAAVTSPEPIGILAVALVFGLIVLAMAYAIGPISGCHINPAVTIAFVARGRMSVGEAVPYIVAQVVGAVIGAALLVAILKARAGGYDVGAEGLAANGYGDHSPAGYKLGAAAAVEVLITAILVFTVFATTDRIANAAFAGIPIGLTVALLIIVAGPVTGASINPARSIGPAVMVGDAALEQLWLFIVAPIVGGVLGAWAHAALFGKAQEIDPAESAVAHDPAPAVSR